MTHHSVSMLLVWATVVQIMSGGVVLTWGFLGFLAGKHDHPRGRAFMLLGAGIIVGAFGRVAAPLTSWVSVAFVWTGVLLVLSGAVVGATALKREKYDRESRRESRRPVSY